MKHKHANFVSDSQFGRVELAADASPAPEPKEDEDDDAIESELSSRLIGTASESNP